MAEEKKIARLVDMLANWKLTSKKTSQKRRPRVRLPISCSVKASKMSCPTLKNFPPLTLRACGLKRA